MKAVCPLFFDQTRRCLYPIFFIGAGSGKPNFDDLDADEGGDSDDEPIPDLE